MVFFTLEILKRISGNHKIQAPKSKQTLKNQCSKSQKVQGPIYFLLDTFESTVLDINFKTVTITR